MSCNLRNLIGSKLFTDIEYGNRHGFFSLTKSTSSILKKAQPLSQNQIRVQLPGAPLLVQDTQWVGNTDMTRALRGQTDTEGAALYDFVSRFIVLGDCRPAYIDDLEVMHAEKNIYHQYSATTVRVPVYDEGYLVFSENGSTHPDIFDNVFYIRDERVTDSGERVWIVHHRLIAKKHLADFFLRICNPRLGNLTFGVSWMPKCFINATYRIRERRFPNCPVMTLGTVTLPPQRAIELKTKIALCG